MSIDAVIEMRQRDLAVFVVQPGKNVAEHMDRVTRGPAVHARMQVAVGGGDGDLFADQSAQHGGDRRRFAVPHAGVADQRQVAGQFVLIGFQERMQRRRAAFLLAFQQNGDAERQAAGLRDPGAGRLDEGHQLALVVGSTPRDDDLAAVLAGDDARLERVAFPQIERVDRLHVVMAVEQHMRAGLVRVGLVADDHRMAVGVADARRNAELGQLARQPVGGGAAVALERGVRGDALDLQKVEQAGQRGVEIGVDTRQDPVEMGHETAPV
jgi:hypothetical protein